MINDKMIVTVSVEYAIADSNGNKEAISNTIAKNEFDIEDCTHYVGDIVDAARLTLNTALNANGVAKYVHAEIKKEKESKPVAENTFTTIEVLNGVINIFMNSTDSNFKETHPAASCNGGTIKNMPTRLLLALNEMHIAYKVIDLNIKKTIYSNSNNCEYMTGTEVLDMQELINNGPVYISYKARDFLRARRIVVELKELMLKNYISKSNIDIDTIDINENKNMIAESEHKTKTVNTFTGIAKAKKVKKPMIHLLVTRDEPHGKELLFLTSITENNIDKLEDIPEAEYLSIRGYLKVCTMDTNFYRSLSGTYNVMSLKNKIFFKKQDDLLEHLCRKNSNLFVSLDALEVLRKNPECDRLLNADKNLLAFEEIVSKYLNLEHEASKEPFGPSQQRAQMAKAVEANELDNMNRLITQASRLKPNCGYIHPLAAFPHTEAPYRRLFPKPSDLDMSKINNLVAESNERDINLLSSKNQSQVDFKKILQDLNYKTRVLLTMFAEASNESELKEDLNILISRANFIASREILGYTLNNEAKDINKIQSLINEMDETIVSIDRKVIYLGINRSGSEPEMILKEINLKDTNKKQWIFGLVVHKVSYLAVKGTSFPKNALLNKHLKNAIISHIESSKCMHYTTRHYGVEELEKTDTLSSLAKDFDIYMRQDDIDVFMAMMAVGKVKDLNIGKVKGLEENINKDTLESKIVNNPRWRDMERNAGVRVSIMKINKSNIVDGNMKVEFLSNVTIECINTEFPDFKLVPRYKANKLIGIIYDGYKQGNFTQSQYDQLVYAIYNGLYMSDEDVEFFLNKEQCENCSEKHAGDFDGNTARLPLEIKDYSLDALKRLTSSLKSFPLSKHFIIFGAVNDTNELLIHDSLNGITRNTMLYRVSKRKASLFQYLDLGDIVLEDLLHAHIYLTPAFVETVCDKLNIGIKTFQRKIFNYEVGRRYSLEEICKRHDFDGDRINCTLQRPLKNPTLDEYAPDLKDKVKEVVRIDSEEPDKELNLIYPIPSVISNYKKTESKFIDIVKRLNMENFNSRLTDAYCLYRYSSDSLLNTSDVYVFLKRSTAADLLRDQKHPLFQHDTNRARIEEGDEPYEKISIPKNTVQILHQCGMVFLEKHIGDRGRIPKVSLEELNKKDEVSAETGLPANIAHLSAGTTRKEVRFITHHMAAKTLRAKTQGKKNMAIDDTYCAVHFGADILITLIAKNSLAAGIYSKTKFLKGREKAYRIKKVQDTFTEFLNIPIKILASRANVYIHEFAIDSICKYFNITKSEFSKYIFDFEVNAYEVINDAVQEHIVGKNKVCNDSVSPETGEPGEPIDLEMIATIESKKKKKVVELIAETKKENLNIWIDMSVDLTNDIVIIPVAVGWDGYKSLCLQPYLKDKFNSELGEVHRLKNIQIYSSEFIDIPKAMFDTCARIWIHEQSILFIQEYFDLKRSEVNDYILDIEYAKPEEKVEEIFLDALSPNEFKKLSPAIKASIKHINMSFCLAYLHLTNVDNYIKKELSLCKLIIDKEEIYIILNVSLANDSNFLAKHKLEVVPVSGFNISSGIYNKIKSSLSKREIPKAIVAKIVDKKEDDSVVY